jgi:hypothetical protein
LAYHNGFDHRPSGVGRDRGTDASKRSPLERLQAKVRVVAVSKITPEPLARKYSSPAILKAALSGDDLHLFPDGTYIYEEWADVEPLTGRDKGSWKLADGLVVLTSDGDLTWDPHAERKYIAVPRASKPHEVLLVGSARDLSYFEKNGEGGAETMLLVVAKERSRTFRDRDAATTKKQLMREPWHPEYFHASPK